MRWPKKTAGYPIEHRFPSSCTSGRSSDALQHLPRDYVDDSDTDEERARKCSGVLSEAGQRMDEKRQLADERLNEPDYLY